ncbi:MAG: hypothetical protein KAH24_07515, partial [Holophagae bacterium]|nr:hypothetical protein [Holophagae bacterium]
RFHEIIGDARRFTRTLAESGGQKYDVVYLNQPEPVSTLLNRFYTVEFFRNVSRILAPEGVISLRMVSTVNYTSGELGNAAKTMMATVRAVFPRTVICPESPHMVFASRSPGSISADPSKLAKRYRRFNMEPSTMALMFRSLYPLERTDQLQLELISKPGSICLNSDLTPVLSMQVARLTGWYSGSGISTVMGWLQGAPWLWAVFLLGFWAVCLSLAKKERAPVLLVAGVVGFSAMAVELVVIYAFQSSVGMVYGKVGLLIGLFMTGLPVGAWWSDRFLRKSSLSGRGEFLLRGVLLLLIILVAVFLLVEWRHVELPAAGFYLIMVADGLLTGVVFPASVAVITARNHALVSAAGWVDALDHGGGALGAMLTGGFLVLILGVPVTLLFLLALLGVVVQRSWAL